MGKNKRKRWAEMETFPRVFQPKLDFHDPDSPLKGRWNETVFGNPNPLVLELGCGKGEYTVQLAQKYPQKNFIGVDIKGARMWRGAKTAQEANLPNAAFLRTRIEFIDKFFAPGEVSEIWLTFPDPQPRESKENRRLTSPWFLNRFAAMLQPGGLIHLKTDHAGLHAYSKETMCALPGKMLIETDDLYGSGNVDPDTAIQTTYESAFRKEGKKICYLCYRILK
jgi:tRNA (guanine-N7-)-methyltransferase